MINTSHIIATELKNRKFRFEAIDNDGNALLIRKAGNLTKGVLEVFKDTSDTHYHEFVFNIADENYYRDRGATVKVFTPGNGIEVRRLDQGGAE